MIDYHSIDFPIHMNRSVLVGLPISKYKNVPNFLNLPYVVAHFCNSSNITSNPVDGCNCNDSPWFSMASWASRTTSYKQSVCVCEWMSGCVSSYVRNILLMGLLECVWVCESAKVGLCVFRRHTSGYNTCPCVYECVCMIITLCVCVDRSIYRVGKKKLPEL